MMNKQQLLDNLEELASKTRWAQYLSDRQKSEFREFMQHIEVPEEGKGYMAYRGVIESNYWMDKHVDEMLEAVNALKEEVGWMEIQK